MRRDKGFRENPDKDEWCGTMLCDEMEDCAEPRLQEVVDDDCVPASAGILELDGECVEMEEGAEAEDAQGSDAAEDLVRTYFHSMGDIAVLTKNEETELAKKVEEGTAVIREILCSLPLHKEAGDGTAGSGEAESESKVFEASLTMLEDLMKKIGSADAAEASRMASAMMTDPVCLKKKWERIEDARRSITAAKDELTIRNLRLVITVAKHYVGRGLPLLDLIQEGNIGLMKAVDRFKYEMGFKFSTYATWWIRQAITRAIMEQGKTIRVPVHIVEFYNRVAKATRELTQELGREPGNREIAKKLRVSVKKVDEVCKAIRTPVALETPVGSEDSVLGDFIGDRDCPLPDASFEKKEISKNLVKILKTLSYREEKVIRMRFGIGVERDHTLEEVGRRLSITRERVRQIEVQAMRKLRHPSRLRTLEELAAL
ncbi:MAG: sigma-70 family RNA polymerase sigma factor [Nitrospiraceae bacterium]|nr:sigma-70 family RNA polymerase sigma factor [Nitrospiraceae bacterium]